MDISRLSLAIADLPLTPFGMRKPSPASLKKVNGDKATSKLSRKSPFSTENTSKFHPSQIRGPKGKENFSPLPNAVNSENNDPFHPKNIKPKSSRRLLAPKTNKLPILLEDDSSDPFIEPPPSRQEKNKSSGTGKMKDKELHMVIEKHYENNTKSFEELSLSNFNPSKFLSSTRIDPRRESIMTDIDEGTLVEFTKTEPRGREIQHVDSLAVVRNNHLYISAQSHLNETECSTSTKKNNARYNFHQLVDAVKKQKMLQQISRVEETSVDSSSESSDNEFALPAPKALASTFIENKRFSQCPLSIPDISSLSIHSKPIGENSSSTDFDYVPFLPKKKVIINSIKNTIPEIASDSIPLITKRVRPVPEIESSSGILPSQTSSDSIPLNTLCNSKGKSNCKELSYPEGFASEEVEFVDVIASVPQSTSLVSEDVSVVDNNTIHKSTALKHVDNSLISEDDIEDLPEEPTKHKAVSPLKTKCTEKCPDTPINRPNVRCNVATPKHADKNTNTPVSSVKNSVFQWVANSPFKDGSFSASFMNEKTKKTDDHSKEAISETSYEEEESSADEIVNTSEPEIITAKTPITNTRKLETVKAKTPIMSTKDTRKILPAAESQTLHLALADDSTSTKQQTPAVRTKKLYPQISLEDSDEETEICGNKYSKASEFKNRFNNGDRSTKSISKTNNKVERNKGSCSTKDKEVYKRNIDNMASPELKSSKINKYEIQKQSVTKTTKKKSARKRIILADSSESSDDNSPMKPKALQKKTSRGSASSSSVSSDSENVTSKYFKTPNFRSENNEKVQQKEHSKPKKYLGESSESEDELSSYMERWGKQKKKEESEQSDSDDSFINDDEESEYSSEEENEEDDDDDEIPMTTKGGSGNELPKCRKEEKQIKGTKFLKDSTPRSLPNDKPDRKVDENIVTISDSDEELPTKFLTPKTKLLKLKTSSLELENTVMQPKKNQFYTPQVSKNVSQLTKVLNSVTKMNSSPCLSFMASLGQDVPFHKQHSGAQKYTKNFMKTREQLTTKLYEMFNAKAFDNGLPSNMSITWNVNLTKTAGRCFYLIDKSVDSGRAARIELSNKVLTEPYRLRDTLVHEMVHACSWVISAYKDGHGKLFKAWASKAMFEFPELPKISTCHSYKITCKYTYKCTKCSHRYERHSKSIDTSKKACGRCKGSLEVFLTKKLDSGTVGSLPATPGPFAAFVKENYSSVKKRDSKLRHNEIMKTLGEQFKRMKAS